MRVLIAPDSFKGSATALEVADAITEGWREERPGDQIFLAPMADGGEGTLEAFSTAVPNAQWMPVNVHGPSGARLDSEWLLLPDGTGVVELARTSGLTLLPSLMPFHAQSVGFGEAINAALNHGVSKLILALGGSSSTDGGAGLLSALGARLLDRDGLAIPAGNSGLRALDSVDLSGLRALPPGGAVILSDVDNPLLGLRGAANIFGPQKGAREEDLPALEANLARFAALLPANPAASGSGAAGGVGFALLAWGAVMSSGSAMLGETLGLNELVRSADVIITGEGRFDSQSSGGKVPWYLQSLANVEQIPALLVAGSISAPIEQFEQAVSLTELAGGVDAAMSDPRRWLRTAGTKLAASLFRTGA
ncbi:glycerate kinase [Arthrobacter sp. Leaf337]|uniref:glycerate kinase n=1 Tax=Bacteria TaxID=2 RepID=UPI0006F8F968|nr:glycerate kinase [Arthrobacter sp. Leaf337]KQR73220.1 glycerate kinase [Arthrobacter sp. Leaf337]